MNVHLIWTCEENVGKQSSKNGYAEQAELNEWSLDRSRWREVLKKRKVSLDAKNRR